MYICAGRGWRKRSRWFLLELNFLRLPVLLERHNRSAWTVTNDSGSWKLRASVFQLHTCSSTNVIASNFLPILYFHFYSVFITFITCFQDLWRCSRWRIRRIRSVARLSRRVVLYLVSIEFLCCKYRVGIRSCEAFLRKLHPCEWVSSDLQW